MNATRTGTLACLIIAASLGGAAARGAALSGEAMVIVGRDLRPIERDPVTDLSWSSGIIEYRDVRGLLRSAPRAEIGLIAPSWWWNASPHDPAAGDPFVGGADSARLGVLALTDGQRLVGWFDVGTDPGGSPDDVTWMSETLGRRRVKLEAISEWRARGARPPGLAAGNDDLVVLTNGDRLMGFVESLGSTVAIRSGATTVRTPVDRVAFVRLANPAHARASDPAIAARVWLSDGSVIVAASVESSPVGGGVSVRLGPALGSPGGANTTDEAASVTLKPEQIAAASLGAWGQPDRAGAITPLARVRVTSQSSEPGQPDSDARVVVEDEATVPTGTLLDCPAVVLTGPMRAEWTLGPAVNAQGRRLSAWIMIPEECRVWGDFEVRLFWLDARESPDAPGRELWAARLRESDPLKPMEVDLPTSAGRIRVTLLAGEHGAIQDRARLVRALLASW
ncbi:MAG: hypothetical protein JNM07_03320 [Phycisphaerae bacterium]|nr:hypothetical protein [Phycisphaerae bacterium]